MPTLRRLAPILEARPRVILVLFCLALWLPGFFTLPPTDRDESRFAQATKQMLETGDYVRIMNGTVPRNRKPIGIHWLQAPFAAAAQQTGITAANPIWPYRMPSLFGGIAAVLATYSLGITLFANRRTALGAGAMLAACVILTTEAHIAKTDAALLGATTITLAVLAKAFMGLRLGRPACVLFWLALALGVLVKGPITPMVVGFASISAAIAWRDVHFLKRLRPSWGVPLTLAAVAPWFIAIFVATHGAFFKDAVGGDLARKMAGGEESHGGLPGLHFLLMPLLAFPATVPVLCGLFAAWRRRRTRSTAFLLCWLLPSWAVFEAVPTKLPHYTLPLYPALMLLGAAWLSDTGRPAWRAWLRATASSLAVLAAILIGIGALALPVMLRAPLWLGVPAFLCAMPAAWFASRATTPSRLAPALLVTIALYTCVLGLELPNLESLWIAPRAEAALQRDWSARNELGTGLLSAGFAEPSLMFLAGTNVTLLPLGPITADVMADHPQDAALVAAPDVAPFLSEAARRHIKLRSVATITGFNYSRGVDVDLTLFIR